MVRKLNFAAKTALMQAADVLKMNIDGTGKVVYNGKEYPIREIIYHDRQFIIGTTELENDLIGKDGKAVSLTAECFDDSIYYYVDGDEIYAPEKEIIELASLAEAV